MDLVLEDFVPYDQSSIWRVHDAYFAACGASAWTDHRIPYLATNNYAIARQHARFLVAVARELDAADPARAGGELFVLEVGSGLGEFSGRFFAALEHGCGEAGRAVRKRLRYVLSDFAARTVREAVATPALARLVQEGAVIPAVFDLRAPGAPVGLDGRPIEGPFAAMIANYVCCVSPLKIVAKTRAGFFEGYARIAASVPDGVPLAPDVAPRMLENAIADPTREGLFERLQIKHDMRPVALLDVLGPVHFGALVDATARFDEASVAYPYGFFDFLAGMQPLVREGAVALVTDFGRASAEGLRGLTERRPIHYGNTVNHDVNFAIVEAWSRRAGLAIARTKNGLLALQTAAVRYGKGMPQALAEAFQRTYITRGDGQDLLDYRSAAKAIADAGHAGAAARMYERALRLDPRSAEIHLECARACIEAGVPRRALHYLRRGRRFDRAAREHAVDFLFETGRAFGRLGRHDLARRAYERGLERRPDDPATLVNLGRTCEQLGDLEGADGFYRRFLERDRGKTELGKEVMKWVVERQLPPPPPPPGFALPFVAPPLPAPPVNRP